MRKPLTILFSAALALAMLPASAFASPSAQPDADAPLAAQAEDTATMYRLYNPNSGEHFYTASPVERQAVIDAGWDDEGEGWTAPTEGVQVYRLYNSFAGEHHYTTSPEERDMLVEAGWTWEEGGWYSDANQAVALYRAYNPNAYANNHHYTTDWGEFQTLLGLGWQDEGIGWYGVDPNAWGDEDWGDSGDNPSSPSNPESPTPTPTPTPTPDPTPTPTPTPIPDPTPTPTPTPDPTPAPTAKYTVNHWQQKLNAGSAQNAANYTRIDSETPSAKIGASVTPEVQQYAGFTAPVAKTVTVKSDGSTKVDYYYTRNSYRVTVTKDNGIKSTTGGGTVQYGANISVSATVAADSDFMGWVGSLSSSNSTYSFSMPAGNVSLMATSKPKQGTVASNGLKPVSETLFGYYIIHNGLPTESSSDRMVLVGNTARLDDSPLESECGVNVQLWNRHDPDGYNSWWGPQVWFIEPVSDGYYRIANCNSMLVMDMDSSSKNVQEWSHDTNNPYQLWKPYESSFGDGSIVFENKGTGLMLSVDSNTRGANVKGAAKSDARGQTWVLDPTTRMQSGTKMDEGYYRLRTQAGSADKYLNVRGNSVANGGNVQLYKNDNTSACVWHVRPDDKYVNCYRITSAYSALCLDVAGANKANGTNVQQFVCNDTEAQLWKFERSIYGGFRLVNLKTYQVLDVDSGVCKDGQNVHSWQDNNTRAQSWKLEKVSGYSVMNRAEYVINDNTYRIGSQAGATSYIDILNASTDNGATVQLWTNTGSKAQVFRIRPTGGGNGAYWIENVNSGKALEVPSASKQRGARISQYTNNGSLAQKWYAKRSIYGGCIFVNANSGLVLSAGWSEELENGRGLYQETPNDRKTQSWVITRG